MAYNGKGIDMADITRQKATSNEAFTAAKKASDVNKKLFGNSNRITGDSKSRNNKTSILKEQMVEFSQLSRSDNTDKEGLDPYSFQSPGKLKAVDKLALREAGYTNTLLTQIIKNQSNPANLQAEIQYRDNVLNLLKEIRDNTKKDTNKKTDLRNGKLYETKTRKTSSLAEAILGGDFAGILKNIAKSSEMGGMGLEIYEGLKDAIDTFKDPMMLKQSIKNAVLTKAIGTLPKDMAEHLTRFKEDAGTYIQDMINQLAFGKNATLRGLTRGSHQAVRFDANSAGKTDMSKEALFDNKFYTAVTFEIPSVLYSIRDGINKTIGDRYDYDKQEWTSLLADIRDMTQSSQSITNGVDQMLRSFSILSEKAIGSTGGVNNTNISQIFATDKNGNVKKDANNRMKYQHETLMRQLLTAFINEGVDSNTLMNVDPHALISGKGLSKYIAKDYHDLLPQVILGLSDVMRGVTYEERSEFDNKRESIINSVERNLVKNKEKLASYSPRDIQAMTQFVQGNISTREFENITGLSVEAFGNRGVNNGRTNTETVRNTGNNNRTQTTTAVITTKEQLNRVLSDPVPSINALKNIDDDLWRSLSDTQKIQVNSIIGRGTIGVTTSQMVDNLLANDITSSVKTLNVEAREELLKKQREDAVNALMNRGGITDKALRERYFNDALTDEDNKELNAQINKYMIANKYYAKMHNANMTATSMAHYVGMGAKASDYERLGFLSDPAQLVPFIRDDGTLNISKLQSKYSKYNEAMMMSIEREDRRVRTGEVFDVATPITSFNKILTNIFSDAKVSRNVGIIGGGAAGYAIGKLLQTQGVVESPSLARMMGVVGSVAMMFSSNREKIQNILGPAGEFKNENGVTNRQIFMAKFINKWLPSIGLGGKVGSMTMKAFKAFGPLGTIVSPFFGLATGLIAGAMAPSLLRIAQRKLFDDDGKGNKGIFKKIGNMLKKFDFVKKYFNIKDNRTDAEIEHDVTRDMIRALEKDNERYSKVIEDPESTEIERTEAFRKMAENERRILELKAFDEELSMIEDDANATAEEKKKSRERAKQLLTGQNQEAYKLREDSAKASRDRSQKGVALHDMDFITKRDMYEASKGKMAARRADEIQRQYTSDKDMMADFIKDYNEGNFDNITDKGAFNIIDKAKKDGRYTDEAIAILLDTYYSKARKQRAENADLAMRQYIDTQVLDANGNQVMSDRQVLMDRASDYIDTALAKQSYDRAIKNGKILLPSEVVGYQKMKEFSEIMQNENLSPLEKEKAIKDWYESLPQEKREQLDTVLTLRQNIAEGLKRTSEDYIQYLSYTNPMLADRPSQLVSRAMFDIQETVALEKFKANLKNLKGIASDSFDKFIFETIDGGYIADDSRTRGRSEQIISSLMSMKYANEQAGGAGTEQDNADTRGNWRMTDFADLTFANGRKVSVAGCALGAFNAAVMKHNFPPMSASAMIDVANEYLSEDGVNMDFFKAMAERIGWSAISYKISENTFTPQNIKSVLTQSGTSAILQLQNIDNNSSHYVTLLNYGAKKCQICDPEASSFKTDILTGDIIARLISITVITKPADVTLSGDKSESKSEKAKKKAKEVLKSSFRNALKKTAIGSAALGVYSLAKWGVNKYKGTTPDAANTGLVASTPEEKTEDPIIAKLNAIIEKINDVINVKIVGDDTIALTNTDLESSKSALQLSLFDAKDSKSRRRVTKIRQLFNKPSFQKDQLKKEAVEDAILQNTAMTSAAMAAAARNGANGANGLAGANGETPQNPDGPKMSGGKKLGILASIVTGAAPYLLGAATSAYIWKDEIKESFFDITGVNKSTDAIYDENGNLEQEGYIANDASKWGTLGKDVFRTAKYASKVWKWIIAFMGKIAGKLLSLGGRVPLINKICNFLTGGLLKSIKATPVANTAINVSKFTKMAGKLLPVAGLISEIFLSWLSFREGKRLAREFLQLPPDIEVPEELAKEVAFANFLYNNLFGLIAGIVGLIPGPGTAAAAVILAIGEMVIHKFYPKSNFFKFFAELNGIPYGVRIGGFVKDKTKGEIIAVDINGAPIPNMRYKIKKNYNEDGEQVNKLGKTKEEYIKDKMYKMNKDYRYSDEWIKFASDNANLSDKEFSQKAASLKMELYDKGYDTTGDRKYERNSIYLQRMKDNAYDKYSNEWDEVGDGPYESPVIQIKKITDKFKYTDLSKMSKAQKENLAYNGTGLLNMGNGTGNFNTIGNISDPVQVIKAVAKASGVDENLMLGIAYQESGLKTNAGAKGSSAKGLFQFVDGTWISAVDKYATRAGLDPVLLKRGMGTANDPRFNPVWNTIMAAFHLTDMYKQAKKDLGRDPLPEEVYMYHGFGAGGAKYFLSKRDNEDSVAVTLGSSIKNYPSSNPYWFYPDGKISNGARTVGGVKAFFREKVAKYFVEKDLGNYNTAFGMKPNPIFASNAISPDIKYGETTAANLKGIMKALPVAGTKSGLVVTSAFGPRNIKNGSKNHKGIDIRAVNGAPIFATSDGVVNSSTNHFGIVQITDPVTGISSRYLHLSKRAVNIGDKVKAGQLLGYAGGTGANGRLNAYSSHLHYEVIKDGKQVDPFKVLELSYANLKSGSAENEAYAKRNGLRSVASNKRLDQSLEKGDGPEVRPYNHIASGKPVIVNNGNDGAIMNLIGMLAKSISALMQTSGQTNNLLGEILTFMKSENRNKSIMSDGRQIARSEI